jgi:oligopeptide transport system substrate-binding protein
VNPELAAQYKAQAIEELTAKGVTFPIVIDYYIAGGNQNAKDTADVLAQIISDCLGDDYVKLNICTYVSSLSNEVRKPQLASMYINGWGADFGDPINFLGQETYGEDNAYYSTDYSMINNATDPELIATYEEFTRLVHEADAIVDDMDARYTAFAEAEAYFVSNALTIPCMVSVSWQLTCANDYSKIYTAYGMQAGRYVNWETNGDIYTTAEYAEIKAAQ